MVNYQNYKLIDEIMLEPRTGTAFRIQENQVLRLTDVEGSQVVDLVSYSEPAPRQYLSSPRTMDYNNKIYFSTGDKLFSDQSETMAKTSSTYITTRTSFVLLVTVSISEATQA